MNDMKVKGKDWKVEGIGVIIMGKRGNPEKNKKLELDHHKHYPGGILTRDRKYCMPVPSNYAAETVFIMILCGRVFLS